MQFLVNESRQLVYSTQRAELDLWFGWLLAFSALTERGLQSLWFPARGAHFLLSGSHLEAQVGHSDFWHEKDMSPAFLASVTARKGLSGMCVWGHIILSSTTTT